MSERRIHWSPQPISVLQTVLICYVQGSERDEEFGSIREATSGLYKTDQSLLPCNEVTNARLNFLESYEVAALAFKMIEKRR
jgi:hypothetical protein